MNSYQNEWFDQRLQQMRYQELLTAADAERLARRVERSHPNQKKGMNFYLWLVGLLLAIFTAA